MNDSNASFVQAMVRLIFSLQFQMRLYTPISVFEIMNALCNFLIFVTQSNLWYIHMTMESNLSALALKCGQINGYRLGLISLTILPSLSKFEVNFSFISSKFWWSGCYEILYMLWQLCCHPLCIDCCNHMIWHWITAKTKIQFNLHCYAGSEVGLRLSIS